MLFILFHAITSRGYPYGIDMDRVLSKSASAFLYLCYREGDAELNRPEPSALRCDDP